MTVYQSLENQGFEKSSLNKRRSDEPKIKSKLHLLQKMTVPSYQLYPLQTDHHIVSKAVEKHPARTEAP